MEAALLFAGLEDCVDYMDINIHHIDDITIVELNGVFDSNTAYSVQETILPLADSSSKLLLDMSNVTYMSSAGLRILLLLYRRISENIGRIIVTGLSESLSEVMAITGFLDFFTVATNRDVGLENLRSA
jgi:anti-sigma B factor antagonist